MNGKLWAYEQVDFLKNHQGKRGLLSSL